MKLIKALKYNIIQHWDNRKLIVRLAVADSKKQTVRTSLGILWLYLRDMVYFVVYTLFRLFVAGSGKIEGMNAVLYVVLGLVPWLFINDILNRGSTIIKSNKSIVKSISFPTMVLPTSGVVCIFIQKIFNYVVAIVITVILGDWKSISIIGILYYTLAMLVLMICINSIVSAFVAVSGDFQQLYLAVTRVMIYTLPVIWSFSNIKNDIMVKVLKLNPMVYVVDGFRKSFTQGFYMPLKYTAYFWCAVVGLMLISSYTQYKLSRFYSDLM